MSRLHITLDATFLHILCSYSGLVEVVPDSITLATIQQECGIRGPLKDGTLKKWFHLCNKTAEDYEKVECKPLSLSKIHVTPQVTR